MKSTIVKCQCVSKKETQSYNPENPISTEIQLQVPYDPNSIYFQLSSGTGIVLNTINKEAADLFVLGKSYDVVITPSN